MIALLSFLLAIAFPFGDAPAGAQTIPPGQEELLAAMLGSGAQLPDGCSFAGGQVEGDVVRATYHCPSGDASIQLSHPSAGTAQAIMTKRFALTLVNGSPHGGLLRAIEALIRAKESEFEWSMLSIGRNSRGFSSPFGVPSWVFRLLLLGLAAASSISASRAWATRMPVARRAALEALIVAAVVVVWLQIDAEPPAHMDTAVDVALARDCITSEASSCLGHAASAIGLVQGQAFTYALALWLYLGLSMRELCFVAACVLGGATGLLHHAIARRFGGVAWVVSAFTAALGVYMTGYPVIWNPSWFVLPLTVAFLATLAITGGSGMWSAFVAGVGFALTSESHLLFGTFVVVAAVIVVITTQRPVVPVTVLLGSFALTEIVVSPVSFTLNALILRGWVGTHLVPAALVALLFIASVPIQLSMRRALCRNPGMREPVAVGLWLLTGAVAIGLVLPWAVSRPAQVRYYGAAFPAIAYAGGWLLDAATLRARSASVHALAVAIFAAIFARRLTSASFAGMGWFMDDGREVATMAGLLNTSALDIQLMIRPMPPGAVAQVAAAFGGTADVPAFPPRIVRAVRPRLEAEVPDGWRRMRVARGEIITGEIDAWTHPEEAELCPDPPTSDPCVTLTRDDFTEVARNGGGAAHRVFGLRIARSAASIAEWSRRGARSLLWKIPLRAGGADEGGADEGGADEGGADEGGADDRREIGFYDADEERIVGVQGTRWTARKDNRALVERPAADSAASITVRTPIADKFEAGVPPMPLELREGEIALLQETPPP